MTLRPLYPSRRSLRRPLDRRLGEPRFGLVPVDMRKMSASAGNRTPILRSSATELSVYGVEENNSRAPELNV
jgi:hypothetical protein